MRIIFDHSPDPGQWYGMTRGGMQYVVFGVGSTLADIEACSLELMPGDKARMLNTERRREAVEAACEDDMEWIHAFDQVMNRVLGIQPPGPDE
ncbi:MAG: hypothetical protein V3T22_10395 [Planctomycetota bacterium]